MPRFLSKYRLLVLGLAILIAAEAWYYYSLSKSVTTNNSAKTNRSSASDSAVPFNPLRSSLGYLRILQPDVVTSSSLTNQFQGEVINVSRDGGTMVGSSFKYKLALTLKGTDKGINTFFYTEEDLDKMKVTRRQNSRETLANMAEIKVSDKLIIKEVLDLTKPFPANRQELSITIL